MRINRTVRAMLVTGFVTVSMTTVVLVALAAALLLPGDNTAEAGGMWFAWLYSPTDNVFTRIYEDGTTETHMLDLPAGEQFASSPRTFAPNGDWIAFCSFNETGQGETVVQGVNFRVHNFNPEAAERAGIEFPVVLPLGNNVQCGVSENAFNVTDQTKIAFGVLNYYPGDPAADPNQPAWELHVFDVTTGQITQTLHANMPAAAAIMPQVERWAWMPLVHRFEGDQIVFQMAPWGTEYIPGENVATWNLSTNEVAPAANTTFQAGVVVHPVTGERIWVAEDTSLPQAQPMGPMPSYNVVMYQADPSAEPVIIYHDPNMLPTQPEFIQGGAAMMFNAIPGFDPSANPEDMAPIQWLMIDRSGAVTPLDLSPFVYTVAGLRDGFVAWESNFEIQSTALYRYQWADGSATPTVTTLWTGIDPNWFMVWAIPQPVGPDGWGPFPAVAP